MTENNETNALVDDPTLDGQVENADNAGVEEAQAEPELFDIANYADKAVKVQVDGKEVTIPLQEAIAGYQRQADYTRKTQELSEQRKQVQFAATLADALEKDPANTLQMLQKHYGLNVQAPQEDEYLDPTEKQLRIMEQRLAAFEQKQAMDELTKTVESLQSKYGDDFNADEVVAKALTLNTTDLESVFKQIAFDKVYSKANEASKKLTEDQSRKQAKREAAIVSSAASAKSGTAPVTAKPSTVFEAFEQAKKTLNL
jgi:hypothetical protein